MWVFWSLHPFPANVSIYFNLFQKLNNLENIVTISFLLRYLKNNDSLDRLNSAKKYHI